MDFKTIKEQVGFAATVLIIGWSGTQLHRLNETAQTLAEQMIAMKTGDTFQNYRLDQHRDQIKEISATVNDNKVRIGKLEIRVFGETNGK